MLAQNWARIIKCSHLNTSWQNNCASVSLHTIFPLPFTTILNGELLCLNHWFDPAMYCIQLYFPICPSFPVVFQIRYFVILGEFFHLAASIFLLPAIQDEMLRWPFVCWPGKLQRNNRNKLKLQWKALENDVEKGYHYQFVSHFIIYLHSSSTLKKYVIMIFQDIFSCKPSYVH